MNLLLAIALVSLTLQFATTAMVLTLGSTPRWRRDRWFAAVSFTAACYALVDVLAASVFNEGSSVWATRANLFNGTLHAVAWLVYSHLGDHGEWASLPRWVQQWAIGGVASAAFFALTGVFIVEPEPMMLELPQLGIVYETGKLTTFGTLVTAVPIAFFALSVVRYWRGWRAGESGAGAILVGFACFFASVLEEIAVSAGWIRFVYLADAGYVLAVAPVTIQMVRRFRDDALQLDRLSRDLAQEVDRRTSERDAARREAVEQQRLAALGRLAAGVGHEINNPLQYLRFNLEELQEQVAAVPNSDAQVALTQAFEGVERIRQVVEGLRTYARPSDATVAPVDLRTVVQAALRVGAPQWRQGIHIDTQFGAVPLVSGNEGRLVQVVLNPLVNGAQAMLQAARPERMRLSVITRTAGTGEAVVEIVDEGPGFAPAVLERLGEPYVTSRSGQGGTGLGLFVTRGIVEAHGGTITFSNRAEGGAMVRITLPAALPASSGARIPAPSATPVNGTPPARPPRLLLVEDDPAALRALARGLEAEGFEVVAAGSAQDALARLQQDTVDLVLTDLMMPGISGPEFARRLADEHPALRAQLVVLTGGASSAEAEAFLRDERLLVLEKPIGRQQLAQHIRTRLAAR